MTDSNKPTPRPNYIKDGYTPKVPLKKGYQPTAKPAMQTAPKKVTGGYQPPTSQKGPGRPPKK